MTPPPSRVVKYPWTADMDDRLRQLYRRATTRRELSVELTRLASSLSRPRYIVANRAQALGLSLLPWKPWTPAELLKLRELAGEKKARSIAKVLGRSYLSVKHQICRMDLCAEVAEGYSIRQLQQLIGVPHARIQMLLSRRVLRMQSDRITEESVRRFVCSHMEEYSFRRVDEAWLKGMLNPNFGLRPNVRPERQELP